MNPRLVAAYYESARLRVAVEDYKGAIEDYTRIIAVRPNDADAYYNRAMENYLLGHRAEVCDDLRRAKELGSMSAFKKIKDLCQ